jgi:hypothetical protein
MMAFKDLSWEWVLMKARAGKLPMVPEVVDSYWLASAQVDVVAINWHDKTILLGGYKWKVNAVGRLVKRYPVGGVSGNCPGLRSSCEHLFSKTRLKR